MATTTNTTTILGREYTGRPMMGSLACSLYLLELEGKAEAAQRLLDAHNHVRWCFGTTAYRIEDDMTPLPLEGVEIYAAVSAPRLRKAA